METPDFLTALTRESESFASAAEVGPMDAGVPTCPDWTLADLVWHLGEVQRFWTQIVGRELQDPDQASEPARPTDDWLVSWFREGSAELASTLTASSPDLRAFSWAGGRQDLRWYARRQAQEAAIHRWDAQATTGVPDPLEMPLASDGVAEFLEWMVTPKDLQALGASAIRLETIDANDVHDVWVRDGQRVDPPEGEVPEATVRATASDMDLLLWRRIPLDVEVVGNREAVERFLAAPSLQ